MTVNTHTSAYDVFIYVSVRDSKPLTLQILFAVTSLLTTSARGHYCKSSFRKVQAITLDTGGCDLVTERIDIGTNLLYDVL